MHDAQSHARGIRLAIGSAAFALLYLAGPWAAFVLFV